MSSTAAVFIYVTCPTMDVAKNIAHVCVTAKLAACANILAGMLSVYEWEGRIQEEGEVVLILKTTENLVADVQENVVKNHPAQIPCVVALPIVGGSNDFISWIQKATKKS